MIQNATRARIVGFALSLVLTLIAYYIIVNPEALQLRAGMAVNAILLLACLQAIIQVLFFLDVWHEKGPPWNLTAFLSTLSIIFIIIFFSIWIMDTLNYRMMPTM